MAKNAQIHVAVMPSTRERLIRFCKDHEGIGQGDVVEDALKDFFERQDRIQSAPAPDLVLGRINALTLSVMELNKNIQELSRKVEEMKE